MATLMPPESSNGQNDETNAGDESDDGCEGCDIANNIGHCCSPFRYVLIMFYLCSAVKPHLRRCIGGAGPAVGQALLLRRKARGQG